MTRTSRFIRTDRYVVGLAVAFRAGGNGRHRTGYFTIATAVRTSDLAVQHGVMKS